LHPTHVSPLPGACKILAYQVLAYQVLAYQVLACQGGQHALYPVLDVKFAFFCDTVVCVHTVLVVRHGGVLVTRIPPANVHPDHPYIWAPGLIPIHMRWFCLAHAFFAVYAGRTTAVYAGQTAAVYGNYGLRGPESRRMSDKSVCIASCLRGASRYPESMLTNQKELRDACSASTLRASFSPHAS
jgi:hypothetical protein